MSSLDLSRNEFSNFDMMIFPIIYDIPPLPEHNHFTIGKDYELHDS